MKIDDTKYLVKYSAECADCHDVITSYFGHDFKYCKCGKIYVDGGTQCPRGGWTDKLPIDRSEYSASKPSFSVQEFVTRQYPSNTD